MPLTETRTALAAQLRTRLRLSDEDAKIVAGLVARTELIKPHSDIIRQGGATDGPVVLIEGYACRYKVGAHGQRQIVSFHLPGDLTELSSAVQPVADHGYATLSRCRIARLRATAIPDLFAEHPEIACAFWADALVDAAIAHEAVMNVGRRDGPARVAHLFCELATRMTAIGRCRDGSFEFPVTQVDLADATGMTPIHMNRVLHRFRAEALLSLHRHCITIHDWERLCRIGDFDPTYLGPLAGLVPDRPRSEANAA